MDANHYVRFGNNHIVSVIRHDRARIRVSCGRRHEPVRHPGNELPLGIQDRRRGHG